MRTIFTHNEVKTIIKNVFLSMDEKISNNGVETDLVSFINPTFYSWKNRLVEKDGSQYNVEDWLESLNYSFNESYALIEVTDSSVIPSQDIDNATISGNITFLVQSDKVNALDYLVSKTRNTYLGVTQDIQNSYGEMLKAYINVGVLLYDEEPMITPVGESVIVSCNFTISYLMEALSYNDTPISFSLDGLNFSPIPYTKATWQNVFTGNAVTLQTNPTRTGALNSNVGQVIAFTFYDFNKDLTNQINDICWKLGAYSVDGNMQADTDPNIPVWLQVKSNGHTYRYKTVITSLQKDITNGDFNTTLMCLKAWGKNK